MPDHTTPASPRSRVTAVRSGSFRSSPVSEAWIWDCVGPATAWIQMSENWTPATRALRSRFPDVSLDGDVRDSHTVEGYNLLTAGFPCSDLSQAGRQQGIFGPGLRLVREVFRAGEETTPKWILLENVPNLLRLGRGAEIAYIVDRLPSLGYSWAYRVLDSRFTGLPQRRRRVLIVASRSGSPASVLLAEDTATAETSLAGDLQPHGFYWTEGRRGAGVVANAVPTLKGGSTLGLPSAPAIWLPTADIGSRFVLPHADHGEVLQGFTPGWTEPAVVGGGSDHRWKLIGNAVTVDVAVWLGTRLSSHQSVGDDEHALIPLDRSRPWPDAAFGTASGQW